MIERSDLSLICKVQTKSMRCCHDFLYFIDNDSKIIHDKNNFFFQRKFKLAKKFTTNHCMFLVTLQAKYFKTLFI